MILTGNIKLLESYFSVIFFILAPAAQTTLFLKKKNMKNIFVCFLALIPFFRTIAGDTISVRSHDNVHMNWYGSYDRWALFPSDTSSFERIWLIYTMGCPTGGCSDWDYTTKIQIRHRTGAIDSNLVQSPVFTVNGNVTDTINFSTDTTYVYSFNTTSNTVDSVPAATMNIILFQNSAAPSTPTDTLVVWTADYYNYLFDSLGTIYDSVFVPSDSTLILSYYSYYVVFDVVDEFEIARVITPYGGNLTSAWSFPYKFDVTDYSSLLKDSVEIRAFFDGWSDGFNVTLDFLFVKGTPSRRAYKVVNLWNGGFPYGDPNNSIENYLTSKTVLMDIYASTAKLKILQTGHGFGGNEDCAEFCPKYNYTYINGAQKFSNLIWKDNCGLNPLYPQPGTWLYDRANWCPGSQVEFFEHELFTEVSAGQSPAIDVDMTPFTNNGNNSCSYQFSSHIVFYMSAPFTRDVSVEEIIAPNTYKPFGRMNPVCSGPRILIKNNGIAPLTSFTIKYGVKGGTVHTYQWSGNIPFMGTSEISLGNPDWTNPGPENIFEVSVSNPNGNNDEYPANDTLRSYYSIPPSYPNKIVVVFKTNNASSENDYYIKDDQGNIVFSKTTFTNNTIHKDTIDLPAGCFTFEMTDSGKDGISFWANSSGTGYLRFYKADVTAQLKNFTADFGTGIFHQFTTGYVMNGEEPKSGNSGIITYPNPAKDMLNIDIISGETKNKITLFSPTGSLVYEKEMEGSTAKIDLSHFDDGLYFLIINSGEKTEGRKILLVK